jgi:glycosyltransferase involved in cell wall biosynthesis
MTRSMKPGLVSVIVASYNHAEYLEERMDSLINQTYKNIEILVIDDCSTDMSVELLKKYRSHPKVNLILRKKNAGFVAASNQGVEMSKGEFIIFANCDDSCKPQMIEKLVKSMTDNQTAGISYCRSEMIDEVGRLLGDDFAFRESRFKNRCKNDVVIDKKEMGIFLLHSCVIPNLSAALFRKNCYLSAGGMTSSYKVCADWDLFFRVISHFDVAYVAEPFNKFRQHKTTIRSSTSERILFREIMMLLLSQLILIDLNFLQRARARFNAMYLWATFILRPSMSGILGVVYIAKVVIKSDAFAILYLPLALSLRLMNLPIKILNYFYKKIYSIWEFNNA